MAGPGEAQLREVRLGSFAVRLALDFPRWVQRRVLHVDHIDAKTTRWRTGVMFRWPEEDDFAVGAQPGEGQTVYVPLELLTKGALAGLDGTRPDGSPVPYLPYVRSTRLAYLGIASILGSAAKAASREDLEPDVRRLVRVVTAAPPEIAVPLFEAATDPNSGKLKVLAGEVDGEPGPLSLGHPVHGLLRELADTLMLLVPATYEPGQEAVYRYEYLRTVDVPRAFGRRALDRLLFRDVYVRDEPLPFGWAQSFHFEVNPPDEVQIPDARLVGSYRRDVAGTVGRSRLTVPVAAASGGPVLDLHAGRPSTRTLEGLALSTQPLAGSPQEIEAACLDRRAQSAPSAPARDDRGIAEVWFRLKPSGTFLVALLVSILTTALLILSAFRLRELEGQTGAALLLAFPGLTLGYLTRPGEHSFVTRLLGGVRTGAAVVGLCALITAWILAGGFIEHVPAGSHLSCNSKVDDVQVHPAPHHTWGTTADRDDPEVNCGTTTSTAGKTRVGTFAEVASIVAAVVAFVTTLWLAFGFLQTTRGRHERPPPPTDLEPPEGGLQFT